MIGWLVGLAAGGTSAGAFLLTGIFPLAILSGPVRAKWRQRNVEDAQRRVADAESTLGCGDRGSTQCAAARA